MALRPRQNLRHTRRVIGVALLALLLAQLGALWHAVAHGPELQHNPTAALHARISGSSGEGAVHKAPETFHTADTGHTAHAYDDDASGHHAGSAVCQLHDHLLLLQAPSAPLWPDAVAPTGRELLQAAGSSAPLGAEVRPYEARGPPAA